MIPWAARLGREWQVDADPLRRVAQCWILLLFQGQDASSPWHGGILSVGWGFTGGFPCWGGGKKSFNYPRG